ncbi:MAG TPA: hypothetical protein VHJ78_01795 [Actinomycetota bacterium]|nr:hypothetical protein [Actinomycetota bacterium]
MDAARFSAQRLDELAELARPVSYASEQALPVLPALESILPNRSLQRGSTLLVQGGPGSHSLALALAAGASQAGSWVAVVGSNTLGVASAGELGVVLERLVLVASPPASLWPTVVAALIDAFDVVLVDWPDVPGNMARRLGMRTRERKAVLLPVASGLKGRPWNEAADVRLTVGHVRWQGIGWGYGRLAARQVEVETGGRRSPRPYRTVLWLPDERGGIRAEESGVREIGRHPAELIPFPTSGSRETQRGLSAGPDQAVQASGPPGKPVERQVATPSTFKIG